MLLKHSNPGHGASVVEGVATNRMVCLERASKPHSCHFRISISCIHKGHTPPYDNQNLQQSWSRLQSCERCCNEWDGLPNTGLEPAFQPFWNMHLLYTQGRTTACDTQNVQQSWSWLQCFGRCCNTLDGLPRMGLEAAFLSILEQASIAYARDSQYQMTLIIYSNPGHGTKFVKGMVLQWIWSSP